MSSSKVSQSHTLISGGLPPSSSAEISVNKNGTSYCSQCKRQISADQPWKRCLSCREKNRGYRKRAAARAALANLEIPNDDHAQLLVNGKRKERTDDTSDRLGGMKKKMRKVFQDKPSAKSTVPSLSDESRDSGYTTYRTATDMYKTLKSSRSSSMIQFRGSFSIVAVDTIDHERRERLVIEELGKIAKWSFAHNKPVTIEKGVGATTDALIKSVSVTYKCTCHKNKTAPPAQPTSTRPNSLLAALATGAVRATAPPKVGAAGAVATVKCKGAVRVSVEEDNSHPVKGIKGQKITIRIKH